VGACPHRVELRETRHLRMFFWWLICTRARYPVFAGNTGCQFGSRRRVLLCKAILFCRLQFQRHSRAFLWNCVETELFALSDMFAVNVIALLGCWNLKVQHRLNKITRLNVIFDQIIQSTETYYFRFSFNIIIQFTTRI
jgi:hypothetical protein